VVDGVIARFTKVKSTGIACYSVAYQCDVIAIHQLHACLPKVGGRVDQVALGYLNVRTMGEQGDSYVTAFGCNKCNVVVVAANAFYAYEIVFEADVFYRGVLCKSKKYAFSVIGKIEISNVDVCAVYDS
jgi:hypothetical protein